jgi:cytohesin
MTVLECVKKARPLRLKALLRSGGDPNEADKDGYSALHWACQYGDLPIVKLLIRGGANLDLADSEGFRPLEVAINCGHPKVARYLIKCSASVSKPRNRYSVVHAAAAKGDISTLRTLMQISSARRFPNARDMNGRTPLHWAAQDGNVKCARLLLSKGATPSSLDRHGFAPLHISAAEAHLPFVEVLLRNGVDIDLPCPAWEGGTCLHFACSWRSPKLIRFLLRKGSDPGIRNVRGKTPIDEAGKTGDEKIVRMLKEHKKGGCDVSVFLT